MRDDNVIDNVVIHVYISPLWDLSISSVYPLDRRRPNRIGVKYASALTARQFPNRVATGRPGVRDAGGLFGPGDGFLPQSQSQGSRLAAGVGPRTLPRR